MWLASELVVTSMKRFAHRLNISSFAASFFVLGILTSLPEFSIALSATVEGTPEIYVGTLIGGSAVIFLFVIPLLAIFGNGITVAQDLKGRYMFLALLVVILPAFSTFNGALYWQESLIMLALYGLLFNFIRKHKTITEELSDIIHPPAKATLLDVSKIIIGVAFILGASLALVESVIPIAQAVHVPPFIISLLLLSLGTNLPELFVAIQSIRKNDKALALGDYIGSAAANTLIFSIFTLINKKVEVFYGDFIYTFIVLLVGIVCFYFISMTKKTITRQEGFLLLVLYILFIGSEFL